MILPRNLLDENIMKYQSINNFTKLDYFVPKTYFDNDSIQSWKH